MVLLAPATLLIGSLIALAIVLDSPGPVFYRAERVGLGGRRFAMLKFRKMRRDERGLPLTVGADHRFTPIGRFLSLTRLDELPQLWNVVRGDMRLIGPRPELPEFVDRYPEPYAEILTVVPGITGLAQLQSAGEAAALAEIDDPVTHYCDELLPVKIGLDIAYVRERSMSGDLRILAMTLVLPITVRRTGSPRRLSRQNPLTVFSAVTSVATLVLLATFAWAVSLI